jgi:hypothetical protein
MAGAGQKDYRPMTGRPKLSVVSPIRNDKWDEQVVRIGAPVTNEKAIAAHHRGSSTQTV